MVNHFLELILVLDLYMSYRYTLQFLSKNKISSGGGRNLIGGRDVEVKRGGGIMGRGEGSGGGGGGGKWGLGTPCTPPQSLYISEILNILLL